MGSTYLCCIELPAKVRIICKALMHAFYGFWNVLFGQTADLDGHGLTLATDLSVSR